ncbi:MAG: hypothetical protein IJ449_05105 [Clostridia bacterium]|nr:hypothetical protein [Clostridia bacterium]
MTIRKFWLAFFTYFAFFAIMILCAFTFGQASMLDTSGMSEDELFQLDMKTVKATDQAPFFALMNQTEYEDFADLVQNGQPNLVVRVTLEDRKSCRVYDPFGQYTNADLYNIEPGASISAASLYLCTPYEAKIEEVLLGDPEQFKEGDTFTFYAPYGMYGDFAVRYEGCPMFSEGREYFLFFSVLDVNGVGRWFDLTHPSAAAEVMIEDERTFYSMTEAGDRLFDAVGYDCEELVEQVAELYAEAEYPLDIPSLTPISTKAGR